MLPYVPKSPRWLFVCVCVATLFGCGSSNDQTTYDPVAIDMETLQESSNVQARRTAANRLATNAPVPETAVEPLLKIIENNREDEEVRCSAARALSQNDDAIDQLQTIAAQLPYGPVKTAVEQAASRP